jgi:hypothetical protein
VNRFLLIGVITAILTVSAYVVTAPWKGKRPEFNDGVIVFLGAVSVLGVRRAMRSNRSAKQSAITAQPMDYALIELGRQANIQIVLNSCLSGGLMSPKLNGCYTAADALNQLLACA